MYATVGDIHGDLRKAIASLEAAQVLQEQQGQVKWSGGDTVIVQLGDVLDRGDSEIGEYGACFLSTNTANFATSFLLQHLLECCCSAA